MLVRGRGFPEPGIVCDRHQKVCTLFDEFSAEIGKDDLETDENAKLALGKGEIVNLFSGIEVSNAFAQRPDEEKKVLHGDILTKRDEVDLVVLPHHFS